MRIKVESYCKVSIPYLTPEGQAEELQINSLRSFLDFQEIDYNLNGDGLKVYLKRKDQ